MDSGIKWIVNTMARPAGRTVAAELLDREQVAAARRFHQSIPGYHETPLISLGSLAKRLGIGGIYVKDESRRFGLNAFKVLGGSYAMARYLDRLLGDSAGRLTYDRLTGREARERLGHITFATATDGNHGRGVAWTASRLGHRSVVYMPKGSSLRRLENIRAEGAEASITEYNYDEAVRRAAADAEKSGWVVVQDTAWAGYEEIPVWIMQGYGTMVAEALDQLHNCGVNKPTHVFVQAGVGSLAAAVQGFFAVRFGELRPLTAVVEPAAADCFFRSVLAGDGEPRSVGGDMATIMAGLACGEPNRLGWKILRDYSELFVSCHDRVAVRGMRMLGNPLTGDSPIISGESGAVTLGLLATALSDDRLVELRRLLRLDGESKVLLFSTEGDTDPDKYRSIVWDGECPGCDSFG